MSKSIIIKGKHNQDLLFKPKKIHKRGNNFFDSDNRKWLERTNQIQLVNSLYLEVDHPIEIYALSELKKKIHSYKMQDEKRDIYKGIIFVTCSYVLEQLVQCKLSCFYCECNLYFLYENVRQKNQWTLDRIDNSQGHNNNNVVIACLDCNLKRRTMNMNTFKDYRALNVQKIDI